jgi:cytochrome c
MVSVKDNEDKTIDKERVKVTLRYINRVASTRELMRHTQDAGYFDLGKTLMENSDCKACHQLDKTSAGPAFMEVSKRYRDDTNALDRLATKIIKGGGGVWGDGAMNAHPQLPREDAREIVKYILSLSTQKPTETLPPQDTLTLKEHIGKGVEGRYLLIASYTDKGGAITPLRASKTLVLRPARVQAEEADVLYHIDKKGGKLEISEDHSYFVLKNVDLENINLLTFRYASKSQEASVEVHVDSLSGPVISTLRYSATKDWQTFAEVNTAVKDPGGTHDLFFIFKKQGASNGTVCLLDWIQFRQ